MRKRTSRFLTFFCVSLCFALYFGAGTAFADSTGKCGDKVSYTYKPSTKSLVLSGTGKMWDSEKQAKGFFRVATYAYLVEVKSGVTSIGSSAFSNASKVTSVILPSSITSVGKEAFTGLASKSTIYAATNNVAKLLRGKYDSSLTSVSVCTPGVNESISLSRTSLSAKSFSYTGSSRFPTVTVYNILGKKLTKGTDYTVTYPSASVNVGTYKVTVKGRGNYKGSVTLSYTIVPKSTTLTKLTAGYKSFNAKWGMRTDQVSGYQLRYALESSMENARTVSISSRTTTTKTVYNLEEGERYYVQVRTIKTVGSTTYYSSWSKSKSIVTKTVWDLVS